MTPGNDSSPPSPPSCEYEPPICLEGRFWLVTVAGTSVALCCVLENAFLFSALVRR